MDKDKMALELLVELGIERAQAQYLVDAIEKAEEAWEDLCRSAQLTVETFDRMVAEAAVEEDRAEGKSNLSIVSHAPARLRHGWTGCLGTPADSDHTGWRAKKNGDACQHRRKSHKGDLLTMKLYRNYLKLSRGRW